MATPSATPNSDVLQLESNSKAAKTKARYNCTNYLFISWLFQNREVYPDLIRAEYLPVLSAAYRMDQQQAQQNSKKKNTHFCHTVIQLLDNTKPSAKKCPVDMQKVDYNIIATQLSSMKTAEDNYKGMSCYQLSTIKLLQYQCCVYRYNQILKIIVLLLLLESY